MALFSLFLLSLPASCLGVTTREKIFTFSDQFDITFEKDLLYSVTVRSRVSCAIECSRTAGCVTFTYAEGSSAGNCRLHSEKMTSDCPCSAAPGARAYSLKQQEPVRCGVEPDSSGWVTFQRREDGSVDFYRNWTEYANGFGCPGGEFWLGLEKLHCLTSVGNWTLRIDLGDWEGNTAYATYNRVYIANSSDKYRLSFDSLSYQGTAGDSLQRQRLFTTLDADNDDVEGINLAVYFHGAWWFSIYSHLNGEYKRNSSTQSLRGILWYDWKGPRYSLRFTEMKIKPVQN